MEERKRREAVIAQARITQRAHRRTALTVLARHGLSILNIGRHFLKVQQWEALQRLREKQPKPKKALPRFLTWLKTRNLQTAGLWKFRWRIKIGMGMKPLEFPKLGDRTSPYSAYWELLLRKSSEKIDPRGWTL